MTSTAPDTSIPMPRGSSPANRPRQSAQSAGFRPQAWTTTRMWPGPGTGTATWSMRRTSPGSPYWWKRTVRIVSGIASWSVIRISSAHFGPPVGPIQGLVVSVGAGPDLGLHDWLRPVDVGARDRVADLALPWAAEVSKCRCSASSAPRTAPRVSSGGCWKTPKPAPRIWAPWLSLMPSISCRRRPGSGSVVPPFRTRSSPSSAAVEVAGGPVDLMAGRAAPPPLAFETSAASNPSRPPRSASEAAGRLPKVAARDGGSAWPAPSLENRSPFAKPLCPDLVDRVHQRAGDAAEAGEAGLSHHLADPCLASLRPQRQTNLL